MMTVKMLMYLVIFLMTVLILINLVESNNGDCTSSESKKECCTNYFMVNGVCTKCPRGTYGKNCSHNCPDGLYGELCSEQCECKTNQLCNYVHGCIACPPRTYGENCSEVCPKDSYSLFCQTDLPFTFSTSTFLVIAGSLIIISIVIGVTVCVVKRNNTARNYMVYQSSVHFGRDKGDKPIGLSEQEQELYTSLT